MKKRGTQYEKKGSQPEKRGARMTLVEHPHVHVQRKIPTSPTSAKREQFTTNIVYLSIDSVSTTTYTK